MKAQNAHSVRRLHKFGQTLFNHRGKLLLIGLLVGYAGYLLVSGFAKTMNGDLAAVAVLGSKIESEIVCDSASPKPCLERKKLTYKGNTTTLFVTFQDVTRAEYFNWAGRILAIVEATGYQQRLEIRLGATAPLQARITVEGNQAP